MTRHRDEATLHAGHNDFKNFDALKQRPRAGERQLDYV